MLRSRSATQTRYCSDAGVSVRRLGQRQPVRAQRQRGQADIAVDLQQRRSGAPDRRVQPLLLRQVAQPPDRRDLVGLGPRRIAQAQQHAPAAAEGDAGALRLAPHHAVGAGGRQRAEAGHAQAGLGVPRLPGDAARAAPAASSASSASATVSATLTRSELGTSGDSTTFHQALLGSMRTCWRMPASASRQTTRASRYSAVDGSSGPASRRAWR